MGRVPGARWLWLSLAVVAADRATKFAIERYTSESFRHPIISDIVVLVHNRNSGIAFGFFSESNAPWLSPLLLLGSAVVIAFLVWLLATSRAGASLAQCGLSLIIGGAAGNAFDRLIHGGVTDFLDVRLGTYHWPAFNAADSAISIGAVLVLIEWFFPGRERSNSAEQPRA